MIANLSVEAGVDQVGNEAGEALKPSYLILLHLVERLHRQLLDVIKNELDRLNQSELNAVQALLLYNIGDSQLSAGELRSRGHYLGSNVSYNLKKMVEAGYIRHERSEADRRSVKVSLTDKGMEVRDSLISLFDRQLSSVEQVGGVDLDMMNGANTTLERLERFWADQIRFRL